MNYTYRFKFLFVLFLFFVSIILSAPAINALEYDNGKNAGEVSVYLDSNIVYSGQQKYEFINTPAVLDAFTGRTLVSIRVIAEVFDYKVGWDEQTSTASIANDRKKIYFWVNTAFASVDGEIEMMDVPTVIIDSRIYVPVRYIAEKFGMSIFWYGNERKIILSI